MDRENGMVVICYYKIAEKSIKNHCASNFTLNLHRFDSAMVETSYMEPYHIIKEYFNQSFYTDPGFDK